MARKSHGNHLEPAGPVFAQPDHFVQETVAGARAQMERCLKDVTSYAQRSPEKALLSALVGGYVLRMLPLTRILSGVLGLALGLLKPAALIYGSAKLWEKTRKVVPRPPDA
jgi:hypothetical protein